MKPSVDTPTPRNLTKELVQTYRGYARTAPSYFGLESTFQPLYGRLNLDLARQNLLGYDVPGSAGTVGAPRSGPAGIPRPVQPIGRRGRGRLGRGGGGLGGVNYANRVPIGRNLLTVPGHHPGTLELASLQRGADIGDVAKYGPAATGAFLQANPYLWGALNNLTGRLDDSPILSTLNEQALAALQSGGQLSPEEQRAADQQARAAYAARGLATGTPALAAEILNRDAAVRQRAAAAQQFASGVQGLNLNQADLVGRGAQIFSTTLSDPFMAILGRGSGAGSQGQQQIGTGARLFDPTNPYAADIYNTNYNAQAAANIANANNQAAWQNASIGAIGSIVGGALAFSDKRLKKNIKRAGTTASGIPVKSFEYRGPREGRRFLGVIAQDVEKVAPSAVLIDPISGFKAVDTRAIDAPFIEVSRHGGRI